MVNIIFEEHVTQTPLPSETSEPTPDAKQAERKRKRSNAIKTVLHQIASVLILHAEILCQHIKMPEITNYVVEGIRVVLNYTFSITGTRSYGIKLFLFIVNVNYTLLEVYAKETQRTGQTESGYRNKM